MLPRRLASAVPQSDPRSSGARGAALVCLVATLHRERALSLALAQHLAEELPDLAFTLEDQPVIDAVWVCGYEPGNATLVRELRAHHPEAVLLVTGRAPEERWADEVLAAGADHALAWPVEFARVARVLRRPPLRGRRVAILRAP